VALRHLSRAGYQVDLAENGQQAVEAYKRKHYDLILMDIQMPVMDGYEATKEIRKLERSLVNDHSSLAKDNTNDKWQMTNNRSAASHIPIIAMTAHAIEGYRERCLEAGMEDYIAKPLRKKDLLAMVEKWTRTIDDFRLKIDDRESETGNAQSELTTNLQ